MGDRGTQDAALVRAAAKGNGDAFGQLFEHHLAAVFEAAWVVLRDREEAARIARDTFVDAWTDVADLPADSIGAWLLGGARDRGVDWLKVNDPDRIVPPLAPDAPPPAGIGPVLRSRIVASLELRNVPTRGRTLTASKSRLRRQPKTFPTPAPTAQWPPAKAAAAAAEGEAPTIPITSDVTVAGPLTPPGGSSRSGVLPTFGAPTPTGAPRTTHGPRSTPKHKPSRQPSPADLLATTRGKVAVGAVAAVLVVGFFLLQRPPGDDSPALPTGQREALASETTTSTQAPTTTTAPATTTPTTLPATTPTTRRTPTTDGPSTPAPPPPTQAPAPAGPKPTIEQFGGTIAPWANGLCDDGTQAVQLWWTTDDADSVRVRPDGGSWQSVSTSLGYHPGCSPPGATWHLEASNSAGTATASFTP